MSAAKAIPEVLACQVNGSRMQAVYILHGRRTHEECCRLPTCTWRFFGEIGIAQPHPSKFVNERFAIDASASGDNEPVATLNETVYRAFKRDIIHGVYQPGEALGEKELAERYKGTTSN